MPARRCARCYKENKSSHKEKATELGRYRNALQKSIGSKIRIWLTKFTAHQHRKSDSRFECGRSGYEKIGGRKCHYIGS